MPASIFSALEACLAKHGCRQLVQLCFVKSIGRGAQKLVTAELHLAPTPAAAARMENYVPRLANLERVLIPGRGHWTRQEKPEGTNRILADWMRCVLPTL
jgi:hypothetical protein